MGMEGIKLRRGEPSQLSRENEGDEAEVESVARGLIERVRSGGDDVLLELCQRFDGVRPEATLYPSFKDGKADDERLTSALSDERLACLQSSALRIRRFAEAQLKQFKDFELEIEDGVYLGQRVDPIESVGAYVPAGRYPLVSSALMTVIPAKVAGVGRIVVASPPGKDGKPHPLILAACEIAGADQVLVSGGAQAIAALAYGTQSLKPVRKIVGPGNAYVAAAKRLVSGAVGIDFYAGPSEVLVVADETANPELIAADLAAQAEHDARARVCLISLAEGLIEKVEECLSRQVNSLASAFTIRESLGHSGCAMDCPGIEAAAEISDRIGPEHLELHVKDARYASERFHKYGSIFIGGGAAEVLGDFSAGINHTLPTAGASHYSAGLSVRDFLCLRTSLETKNGRGKRQVALDSACLAGMEMLPGHELAARLRTR